MSETKSTTLLSTLLGDIEGKMSIDRCERIAKDLVLEGVEPGRIRFDLVGPKGRVQCTWLDPYLGFFQAQGLKGFMTVRRLAFVDDVWVENVGVEEAADAEGGG